jgi:hypothetical protein
MVICLIESGGKMGAFFLIGSGIVSLIASFLVLSEAKSAIHEILGAVLSVDGSILIVGGMVISALNSGQAKTEALLKSIRKKIPSQRERTGDETRAGDTAVTALNLAEEEVRSFTQNRTPDWDENSKKTYP